MATITEETDELASLDVTIATEIITDLTDEAATNEGVIILYYGDW